MALTDKEHQARLVRHSLAEIAGTRVKMLVANGRVAEAIRAVEDIAGQHEELMESLFNDPSTTPVEFCGLPRRLTEILQTHDYMTIGDLLRDWPGKLLSLTNVEIVGHYLIGRMLAKFNLIASFKASDYT